MTDTKSPEVRRAERRLLFGENTHVIKVEPYGLLGERFMKDGSKTKEGEELGEGGVLTDPAGLEFIHEKAPSKARGVAGEVYRHLGVRGEQKLPPEMQEAETKNGQAKLHCYWGKGKVIHVATRRMTPPPRTACLVVVVGGGRKWQKCLWMAGSIGDGGVGGWWWW